MSEPKFVTASAHGFGQLEPRDSRKVLAGLRFFIPPKMRYGATLAR